MILTLSSEEGILKWRCMGQDMENMTQEQFMSLPNEDEDGEEVES